MKPRRARAPRVVLPDAILAGARHFNAREFFEAHEAWEDHWGLGDPPERAVTLGLIKAAVALHHLANGNDRGFHWQCERAIPLLREHAGVWPALATDALADALESVASQVRFHGSVAPAAFPRLPVA